MLAHEGEPFSSSRRLSSSRTVEVLGAETHDDTGRRPSASRRVAITPQIAASPRPAIQAGVECEGAAAGEDEKEEREAVQDREFAAVGHRDDSGR